jgi:hypothetical protein
VGSNPKGTDTVRNKYGWMPRGARDRSTSDAFSSGARSSEQQPVVIDIEESLLSEYDEDDFYRVPDLAEMSVIVEMAERRTSWATS